MLNNAQCHNHKILNHAAESAVMTPDFCSRCNSSTQCGHSEHQIYCESPYAFQPYVLPLQEYSEGHSPSVTCLWVFFDKALARSARIPNRSQSSCRFGSRCWYQHTFPNESNTASPSVVTTQPPGQVQPPCPQPELPRKVGSEDPQTGPTKAPEIMTEELPPGSEEVCAEPRKESWKERRSRVRRLQRVADAPEDAMLKEAIQRNELLIQEANVRRELWTDYTQREARALTAKAPLKKPNCSAMQVKGSTHS